MATYYKNKYRNETVRFPGWDYSSRAGYFITLCTHRRVHYFGEIAAQNESAILKPTIIGEVAREEWIRTKNLRHDMNLALGEFVVMPDHIHAIIFIGANEFNENTTNTKNRFGHQSKNLASIIRGYKSAVTTFARRNQIEFQWQTNYYDHIIKSESEFERISKYIINNPKKWLERQGSGP